MMFMPLTTCPACGDIEKQQLLSTTNEWRYCCPICDIRYNDEGTWLHEGNEFTRAKEQ